MISLDRRELAEVLRLADFGLHEAWIGEPDATAAAPENRRIASLARGLRELDARPVTDLEARIAERRAQLARELLCGLRPVAYPTPDGWTLLARSTCDGWRVYAFDAAGPIGDYGPAPMTRSEHEGLLVTARELGADLTRPTDPRTVVF